MKTLPIDQLQPGMVLADDLLADDGRVLLAQGTELKESHISGLGRRGVVEARVEAEEPERPPTQEELALLERSQEYVHPSFEYVDPDHPAMQELYRLCVLRTAAAMQQGFSPPSRLHRADAGVEDLQDMFLKHEGAAEDVVLHEVQLVSFPEVYFQILAVLRSPTSSASDIAEVVSRDSSLAAKLLKLVNSPFYGFPSRIDSLPRAVALLGGNELSTLALGVSAISVFKDIPPELVDMRSFWTHSLSCAIFARLIAGQCDKQNQERHFVAGLLHDIGKLLLYKKLPYASAQALVYSRFNSVPEFESEKEVIGFDHTRIGLLLVEEWNFPRTLADSIALHHSPPGKDDMGPCIVHLADIMALTAGIGSGSPRVMPQLSPACWDRAGLTPEMLAGFFETHDASLQQLAGVFA